MRTPSLLLPALSLVLHFGLLNVLAGVWRSAGANCRALFRAPLCATSLTEFWGRRWNLAFSEMAATAVFRPLSRWAGSCAATAVVFLFSGLLHELAISLPVRAGFGLPLLYLPFEAPSFGDFWLDVVEDSALPDCGMPLRGLSVSCLNVDEVGLSALPAFPALRELMPMDIPDAGYRHIGECELLESLILMYCRDSTDAATEHIVGLRKLSYYFNSYTTITDRTPELLSTMESLERITFDTCHGLTNGGVAKLARLPRLRELRVSGKGITPDVHTAFPAGVGVCVG